MPNALKNLYKIDEVTFPYIFEQNADIDIGESTGPVRCNVYRPKGEGRYPVLVTYGPYGKDVPYSDFHAASFSEVNPKHKSIHSAWETPDPGFWTRFGYAIVRADERGLGQSPGILDTMSKETSEGFYKVIEWAADQKWSSGKVGLLGVSYYAGSQWRVAARRPKGLAAIIPWEGMADYYRDRGRHGGILSNTFLKYWWDRQIITNQYGLPGRAARNWGPDTLEGDLSEEELAANRRDQTIDNARYHFMDEEYYASKDYNLEDIEVPVLSVGNWGGILLHLRGNVEGFTHASSALKYLRFNVGRHDLPFYYDEEVEVQRSFLDAFLKGEDRVGWSTPGRVPQVSYAVRKGDVGHNNPDAEKTFIRRYASQWPLPNTIYTKFFLTPEKSLVTTEPGVQQASKITYKALGSLENPSAVRFETAPVTEETEITGHIVAHLNVSVSSSHDAERSTPTDMDIFLAIRHISPTGNEILYTGTTGDAVPPTKGWLRVSLRKVNEKHPKHRPWLPHRDYFSTDVQSVQKDEIYAVDVEIWPTNFVVEKGGRIVFELSSGDTQGTGIFLHNSPEDRFVTQAVLLGFKQLRQHKLTDGRSQNVFGGLNNLHFAPGTQNYVTLPIIPQ